MEMTLNGEPFQLYRKPDRSDRVDRSSLPVVDFLAAMRAAADAEGNIRKRKFDNVEDTRRQQALEQEKKKSMALRVRGNYFNNFTYNDGANNNARRTRITRIIKPNTIPLPNTISVPSSGTILAEYTPARLSKLPEVVPLVEDIGMYCLPCLYNKDIEKLSAAKPRALIEVNHHDDMYRRPDLFEDQVLRSLMTKMDVTVPLVVITDDLLSLLLTAHRSVNPWHIKVARFDKAFLLSHSNLGKGTRADHAEKQWVGETAQSDVAPSEGNPIISERISSLGEESTKVHESFITACCSKTRAQLSTRTQPNKFPFPTQPRMYRYRRFTMNPNTSSEYNILVRCDIDAVTEEGEYLRMFGLLEQVTKEKENWRGRLKKGQGTTIVPDAFPSNSAKISRWVALSLLSEVKAIKIGLITRSPISALFDDENAKTDPTKHSLLKVETFIPATLLRQLNLNYNSMWATANTILLSLIQRTKAPFGLIVKHNNRMVTIADTPDDNDDDDSADDDADEDEEDYEDEEEEESEELDD